MFKVNFIFGEDNEFGSIGWKPERYPEFNVTEGFGLVHDVLEHFPEDDPDLAGEMKALGSLINIRGISGWWQPFRSFTNNTPEQNMAAEIARFIRDVGYNSLDLRTPPRTYRCDEDIEAFIDESMNIAKEDYLSWLDSDEVPMPDSDIARIQEKMRGWLRIGYRQSVKRFYGACHDELTQFFNDIERAVHKLSGDWGEMLSVTVHPRRLKFSVDVTRPWDEDYDD